MKLLNIVSHVFDVTSSVSAPGKLKNCLTAVGIEPASFEFPSIHTDIEAKYARYTKFTNFKMLFPAVVMYFVLPV